MVSNSGYGHAPATEFLIMPGACRPEEIEDMKRQTRDGVIELAGDRRRSGVGWRIVRGRDACRELLDQLYRGVTKPGVIAGLDQFRTYFDEQADDAVLIVAMVEAVS